MQTPDTVSRTTLEWWNDCGAWSAADTTYTLLTFLDSIGYQHDETEQYTRDDPTHTGWGQLLDVNTCPSVALPWLAQFAGVVVPIGASDADIRSLITTQPNTKRGTLATLVAAAQPFLTGTKRVDVVERTPDPYSFKVVTYLDETPDPAAVHAALIAVKPAGLVMAYVLQEGPLISQLVGTIGAQTGAISGYSNEEPP